MEESINPISRVSGPLRLYCISILAFYYLFLSFPKRPLVITIAMHWS